MQRRLLLLHVVAVVKDRIPERRNQQDQTRSVDCRSNYFIGGSEMRDESEEDSQNPGIEKSYF